ncbi:hypothetical protein TNCV_2545071 [Trichonephila clavipes]|nr:hypothetical protein TNCV_2545071 [Trichonephila clavipes]
MTPPLDLSLGAVTEGRISRKDRLLRSQKWKCVLFRDELRFTIQSDSRRVFIWKESGARFHSSYVTKIDGFDGKVILAFGSKMLGRHTPLHVFDVDSASEQCYRDEVFLHFNGR